MPKQIKTSHRKVNPHITRASTSTIEYGLHNARLSSQVLPSKGVTFSEVSTTKPIIPSNYELSANNLNLHNLSIKDIHENHDIFTRQQLAVPNIERPAFGIDIDEMDSCASRKEKTKWDWAACIQMIMNLYNINIDQIEIVSNIYGLLNWVAGQRINKSATDKEIVDCIEKIAREKKCKATVTRYKFNTSSLRELQIILKEILAELELEKPIMISYRSETTGRKNFYILTGMVTNSDGSKIDKLYIRNPSNKKDNGRELYEDTNLISFLDGLETIFLIDIEKKKRKDNNFRN